MKNTFRSVDILLTIPLLTVLGFAIFLGGCSQSYSYTHSPEIESSNMQLREHIKFNWTVLPFPGEYTGPQNALEMTKALDSYYNRGHSKTEVSVFRKVGEKKNTSHSSNLTIREVDARYPRAEWLQMLLDRGIAIKHFDDYSRYLLKRHTLTLLEDNPDLWQLEIYGIAPTDNWETYKAAYIDKLVRDHLKYRKS